MIRNNKVRWKYATGVWNPWQGATGKFLKLPKYLTERLKKSTLPALELLTQTNKSPKTGSRDHVEVRVFRLISENCGHPGFIFIIKEIKTSSGLYIGL